MIGSTLCLMVCLWRCTLAIPHGYVQECFTDLDSQYPEVVTGTYDVDIHKQDSNRFKRNVVPNSSGQWPQTKIPYKITQDFSELDKKKFLTAMKTIEDLTRYNGKDCITFVNQTNEEIYIKFVNADGCGSQVGYNGRVQKIYLSVFCRSNGIVVHELLHVLGLRHEQSRPDRDDFIEINTTNIHQNRRPNFRKIDSSSFNTLNLPYDYDSIMHYPHNAFAIDGRYSTIITKVKGVRIGQRIGMSQLDIKKVQRLYGCLERELVPPQNGNISSPNCTFDKGLCGWNHREINSPMNANKWVRHSFFETSPNTGPTYDHTYRTFQGFYLYLKAVPNQDSVARIQTPQLPPGNYCLTFWYQIRGLSRVSLQLNRIEEDNISPGLFLAEGNQSQTENWTEVTISITATANTQIEFEGRIGNSSSTDIAVDDVIFLPRLCSRNLHTSSK
ncbi:astacin-like metalloprotease toxin 2 [Octopus sinensis]|uniref:Metalloendopeptidase n=1 Tax=Octopus sinensis TaxID=2607531 RepID=A0A7E6F9K7_9MOLL|nr:astacin-like metalloprotease toxin 2 [Octopus sinensis]